MALPHRRRRAADAAYRPSRNGTARRSPTRTLLLVADQGFGDVIQFCRYIPWAAARCPDVAVACSAEMPPLLRQFAPSARLFIALGGRARLRGVLSRCPACRGWHGTRVDNVSRRRSRICAPIQLASRTGRSG